MSHPHDGPDNGLDGDPDGPSGRGSDTVSSGAPETVAGHPVPSTLSWPAGMDETAFLARHWQRAPLLIRRALPDFVTPLPPDELAGLSLEPEIAGRLVRRREDGAFSLDHGPFDEGTFETLGPRDWSLLVTDVDKHVPELGRWLAPFRLAPDWRLDDLMISYAPDGSSVGAHVDEYDVFLLQASGVRRWSIDAATGSPDDADAAEGPIDPASASGGDLRLVDDFVATDTWDLEPGDVLYLPPGVAHHGVAVGDDCTTWSIGFRAPSAADVALHAAELVAERLAARQPQTRLLDEGRGRGLPGEITDGTVDAVAALLREALTLDRAALVELTGRLLTRAGAPADDEGDDEPLDDDGGAAREPAALVRAPFTRLAWTGDGMHANLFVNGERVVCPRDLARALCGDAPLRLADVDPGDRALIDALRDDGVLVPADDDRA